MFKTILLPVYVHYTESLDRGLSTTGQPAYDDKKIRAVQIFEGISSYARTLLPDNLFDLVRQHAPKKLQRILDCRSTEASARIRIGRPSVEVLDFAKETGTDIIIVGLGESDLATYLSGSTATRVVQHATCPALIMH
ncbi:MAG: universal stress protein [Rhizobiaceae bacterium]